MDIKEGPVKKTSGIPSPELHAAVKKNEANLPACCGVPPTPDTRFNEKSRVGEKKGGQ